MKKYILTIMICLLGVAWSQRGRYDFGYDSVTINNSTITNSTITDAVLTDPNLQDAILNLVSDSNDPSSPGDGDVVLDNNGGGRKKDKSIVVGDDSGETWVLGQKIKPNGWYIESPSSFTDPNTIILWQNRTGYDLDITGLRCMSDTDNIDINLEMIEDPNDFSTRVTIDAVVIDANGTEVYYKNDNTITAADVNDGAIIVCDMNQVNTPGWIHIDLSGTFDGDVN